MIDQITSIMEDKNLSATQFADEIGIQRSSLSHVLSGRNKPSLDFMLKIKGRFPEINLDWLLLGKGEMLEKKVQDKKGEDTNTPEEETSTGFDLFQKELEPKQTAVKDELKNVISGEDDPPSYAGNELDESLPEKIIVLYSDNTFSVYKQKKG